MQSADYLAIRATPSSDTWLVSSLTLAVFTSSTFWLSLSPFLPVLAEDLSTSIALLGQVPALLTLLAALLGLPLRPIADRSHP